MMLDDSPQLSGFSDVLAGLLHGGSTTVPATYAGAPVPTGGVLDAFKPGGAYFSYAVIGGAVLAVLVIANLRR